MDTSERYKGNKRKHSVGPKENPIPFKVFKYLDGGRCSLKISKPDKPEWESGLAIKSKDCPDVILVNESSDNIHGLNIMYSLNHKNIVRMEAAGRTVLQKDNEITICIEHCEADLLARCWDVIADNFGQMQSETFQNIVREIVCGIDFLRKNGTYHGGLSWETTRFVRPYTVKLFGFRSKEMPVHSAQWEDWNCLANMLEVVSTMGRSRQLIYDDVDALIDMIRTSNVNSLPMIKDTVLESAFFFTPAIRSKIMMTVVPALLKNSEFRTRIFSSDICCTPWDSNEKNRALKPDLADRFKKMLDKCNSYRSTLDGSVESFDPDSEIGLVKLAYAAYTHQNQLQEQVDFILRARFPKFFSELQGVISSM